MAHGWLITRDYLNAGSDDARSRVGTAGPCGLSDHLLARLKAGEGSKFRMKDDDGEIYYAGRFIDTDERPHVLALSAFSPLDDFGTPDAGATSIEYFNPDTRKYEPL